jgi:hypothetical protein
MIMGKKYSLLKEASVQNQPVREKRNEERKGKEVEKGMKNKIRGRQVFLQKNHFFIRSEEFLEY